MVPNAPIQYETHQKVSLGSNGVDQVRLLQKILTRLRGTTFCTTSARFAPSFVKQPNGPKCTQMVRNAPKHEFMVQWGGSGAFVVKNSDATSWHEDLHSSACCALSFVRQLNGPECTQIERNTPKHHFRVQWVDQVRSLRKIPTRLRGTNFCTSFGPFCTEFRKATKRPRMHPNCMKCTKTSV